MYDVDYSYLRNYNTELGRISSNLNQIAKRVNSTGNIYQEDINEVKELMNKVLNVDKLKAEYQELMKQKNLNQHLGKKYAHYSRHKVNAHRLRKKSYQIMISHIPTNMILTNYLRGSGIIPDPQTRPSN